MSVKFLVAGSLLLLVVGCVRWRTPRFEPPADFASNPLAARLINPQTRITAWEELSPELQVLQFGSQLTARGRWWQGKERFSLSYFTLHPEEQQLALRLRGYQSQFATILFDVLVHDDQMTVVFPTQHVGFTGPLSKEGTPFRDRYGIEPWQLNDIFMISRMLSKGIFQESVKRGKIILTSSHPAEPVSTARIELDSATGLPIRAIWKAGKYYYEVHYLSWDWFSDNAVNEANNPGKPRLMPKRLEIHQFKPNVMLDLLIDHYQFALIPPKMFLLDTHGIRFYPLKDLGEALGGS